MLDLEVQQGRRPVLELIQRRQLGRVRLDVGELAVLPNGANVEWLLVFRRAEVEPKPLRVRYSRRHPQLRFFTQDKDERGRRILLTKARDWAYEREWRVFDAESGPGLQVVTDAGLAGVILGCRISAEDEQRVRQWIHEYNAPIKLHRAVRSPDAYALQIVPAG